MEVGKLIKCKDCGRVYDIELNIKICESCGALMGDSHTASTRNLGDADTEEGQPRWGSAKFNQRTLLILGIGDDPETFKFKALEIEELVLGREDLHNGKVPAVNLSAYGAVEHGVSRNHAKIIFKDSALQLVDNASKNGTYLNGQKLVEHQPRVLRDGDDVRLGRLVMRVTYRQEKATQDRLGQVTSTTESDAQSAKEVTDSLNAPTPVDSSSGETQTQPGVPSDALDSKETSKTDTLVKKPRQKDNSTTNG